MPLMDIAIRKDGSSRYEHYNIGYCENDPENLQDELQNLMVNLDVSIVVPSGSDEDKFELKIGDETIIKENYSEPNVAKKLHEILVKKKPSNEKPSNEKPSNEKPSNEKLSIKDNISKNELQEILVQYETTSSFYKLFSWFGIVNNRRSGAIIALDNLVKKKQDYFSKKEIDDALGEDWFRPDRKTQFQSLKKFDRPVTSTDKIINSLIDRFNFKPVTLADKSINYSTAFL